MTMIGVVGAAIQICRSRVPAEPQDGIEFYYNIIPPRKHLQPQGLNKRMKKVPRAGTTMAGKVCIHIRIYFGSR